MRSLVAFVERQYRLRRLLRTAEEVTLNPAVLRRVKRKIKEKGVESLSPKEKKLLSRLDRMNRLREKGVEKSLEGRPSPEADLENDFFSRGEQLSNKGPAWRRFISEEQWAQVPDDKKPMMEKWFQERLEIQDPSTEKSTEKGWERFKQEAKQELGSDLIEEGDHAGAAGLASRQLLLKIKNARRLANDRLKALSGSDNPAERAAAKELSQLVPEALAPLAQVEDLLKRIDPVLEEITPQNAPGKLKLADQAIEEGLRGFRTWGSQLQEVFGGLRTKNQQAIQNLKNVAGQRFKEAMKQFRAQGLAPEEAAQRAKQLPALQKMMSFIQGAEVKVQAYDYLMNELASIYEGSRVIMKKLRSEFQALKASLSDDQARSASKKSKSLRKASKRLDLLQYLGTTSQESLRDSEVGNGAASNPARRPTPQVSI